MLEVRVDRASGVSPTTCLMWDCKSLSKVNLSGSSDGLRISSQMLLKLDIFFFFGDVAASSCFDSRMVIRVLNHFVFIANFPFCFFLFPFLFLFDNFLPGQSFCGKREREKGREKERERRNCGRKRCLSYFTVFAHVLHFKIKICKSYS